MEHFFQDGLLEQFELRLVAKETGFVDGENFQQCRKFCAAFTAGEQTIVAVERIEPASFQTALQTVL